MRLTFDAWTRRRNIRRPGNSFTPSHSWVGRQRNWPIRAQRALQAVVAAVREHFEFEQTRFR